MTSPPRRAVGVPLAAAALIAAASLAGCSNDDKQSAPTPSATGTVVPTSPTVTQPGDISTRTTASALPVPKEGPTEVKTFPVPPGVRVKGPGPQERSWEFDITTKDPDGVLAFYRKALRADGYTVKNDVDITIGVEEVHYDIQFGGPARGYIVNDPSSGTVFVSVQSLPGTR